MGASDLFHVRIIADSPAYVETEPMLMHALQELRINAIRLCSQDRIDTTTWAERGRSVINPFFDLASGKSLQTIKAAA